MNARRTVTATLLAVVLVLATTLTAAAAGGRPFVVPLSGGATGDQDGTGQAILTVNAGTGEVCYAITVSGIGEPTEPAFGLGAAHIHDLATGGIFVDLETDWVASDGGFSTTGCTSADRSDLIAILRNPSGYYVNIHTTEFPGGAISGSLG